MKLHRYIVIAVFCLYFNVSAVAQQNDSIIELQEFVVQAQSQRVKAGGMMVTPTEVQKKVIP